MSVVENEYKPGDYILQYVGIIGSTGEKLNITKQVIELNIYQSIDAPCMTGDIVIQDSSGTAEFLPFIGQERILFTLHNPFSSEKVNFEDYHAVVSNIADRFTSTENTQVYRLEFVTVETLANVRTKVSQSFKGEISSMVKEIVKDPNYLNSKKPLFIEETRDVKTYVAPNLRPFQVIAHLAEQAISKEDQHSGYLFFENTRGYHFRSFESLMGKSMAGTVSPTSKIYKLQPASSQNDQIEKRKENIISMDLIDSMDTLSSSRVGLFGSTLFYHDVFNKNVIKKEFSYFTDTPSTSVTTNHHKNARGTIASVTTINGKGYGDFPESRIFVHSTSSDNLHTDGVDNNADEWLQTSASRYYEQDYFQLQIVTYGDADLAAGDLVQVQIPSNRRKGMGEGPDAYDQILSGRYLVADLKHSVSPTEGLHGMTLRLIKDSLQVGYPAANLDFGDPPDSGSVLLSSGDYKTPDEVNSLRSKL